MPFFNYDCWVCSGEKKRGNVGFAFAAGVPKGTFLCNHALLIDEGVGWSIADHSCRKSSIFYRQKRSISA
jgi:hypothetical protein